MRKFKTLLVALLLLMPINVHASEKYVYLDDNASSVDKVDSSAIFAGEKVEVNTEISGVGGIFGNIVIYGGKSEYAVLAGSDVTVSGSFSDGAVFGDNVTLKDNTIVNRDVALFGNTIKVAGNFNRNVIVFANTVTIENATFGGDLTIHADKIIIKDSVSVAGKLSLSKEQKDNNKISSEANIVNINYFEEDHYNPNAWQKIKTILVDLLKLFVVFALTLFIIPNFYKKVLANKEDYGKTLGIGFLSLIIVPIAALILIMTILGLPFGLMLIALYALVIYSSTIITGYYFGDLIWKKYFKIKRRPYLVGLFGITVIYILTIIPAIGGLIHFLSILFTLGIITKMLKNKTK